jgi:hypothetical protein
MDVVTDGWTGVSAEVIWLILVMSLIISLDWCGGRGSATVLAVPA